VNNTVLGALLGLILGVGLAFLIDRLDRRLRDPQEIENMFGRPILGVVPESRALAKGGPAAPGLPPREAEAFRMLRANLRYFNVNRHVNSILITSAAPGDGKSSVAWNLAFAAAGSGAHVLLMEADLRHPSIGPRLPGTTRGLTNALAGEGGLHDVIHRIPIMREGNSGATRRTMDVIVSGPLPPNPTDLLDSDQMRRLLREAEAEYDLVVIDTPPTSVVSDAIPLVNQVSGVIVVTRLGKSLREAVRHLRNQLTNLDAPLLGVVINEIRSDDRAYGYAYGYEYERASVNGKGAEQGAAGPVQEEPRFTERVR
jgi:capsular exopolysaccharide synthesis family protein